MSWCFRHRVLQADAGEAPPSAPACPALLPSALQETDELFASLAAIPEQGIADHAGEGLVYLPP